MINIDLNFLNKELELAPIRTLFVQGENVADIIKINMPKMYNDIDLGSKVFVIKMLNRAGEYYEAVLPKNVSGESIVLEWTVTKEFTSVHGILKINVIALDDDGSVFSSKEGILEIQPAVMSSGIPITPETIFEDYLQEMRLLTKTSSESSKKSEAVLADMNSKIVNDVVTGGTEKVLSAEQGKNLSGRINNIITGTGTSPAEVIDARYSDITGITYPTLANRLAAGETEIKKLQNSVGAYGVRWNETDDVWTRLGQSTVLTDFSKAYPFGNVKRCNLDDAGKVTAYYGDPTFKEDGTNGQVMVEYPKTYSKYLYYTVSGKTYHEWWVSRVQYADFEINPAFIKGTSIVDKFYLGAYEGSIYDVSASAYLLADEQVADFTATTGDKLSSIGGAKPCSGLTQDLNIVKSRIIANNRGANWGLWNGNQVAFVQMLLMIEYGHANSQTAIGSGVVNKASGTGNESELTGATSFLGNLSGRQAGTDGLTSVSYRGLENMWGNIYSFVDGINIQASNKLWINTTNQNFASDLFASPYALQGILSNTNGYVSNLLGTKYGMFPTQNTGSSTTKIPDYYYQNLGIRIAPLGGSWNIGSYAGFACWSLSSSSVTRDRLIGARLCYF